MNGGRLESRLEELNLKPLERHEAFESDEHDEWWCHMENDEREVTTVVGYEQSQLESDDVSSQRRAWTSA
jgi:hypothetical protein